MLPKSKKEKQSKTKNKTKLLNMITASKKNISAGLVLKSGYNKTTTKIRGLALI